MSCDCGCCSGIRAVTPVPERNRPGLGAIDHRPGTYATFLETMRAGLSSADYPELAPLRTRASDDASVALCDAWAVTADVLAFYQNRIANEGYLRTATERRSLLELGRLTGYAMRPGVSASVYLAYEIDPNAKPLTIPVGTRVQSVPGPGETMQTFETAEPVYARQEWSRMKARLDAPQWRESPVDVSGEKRDATYGPRYDALSRGLYVEGTNTQLKPNDVLLIDYGLTRDDGEGPVTRMRPVPYFVDAVEPDTDRQRTKLTLREFQPSAGAAVRANRSAAPRAAARAAVATAPQLATLVDEIGRSLRAQPRNTQALARDIGTTLRSGAPAYAEMLLRQKPAIATTLFSALRSVNVTDNVVAPIRVFALRTKAALFGNGAPRKFVSGLTGGGHPSVDYLDLTLGRAWFDVLGNRDPKTLAEIPLDAVYDQIKPADGAPSYVLVASDAIPQAKGPAWRVMDVVANRTVTMTLGPAFSSRVSELTVDAGWLVALQEKGVRGRDRAAIEDTSYRFLYRTNVYAQSEELTLAGDALDATLANIDGDTSPEIELDAYYDGLKAGQWAILAGEYADADKDAKVDVAERGMIAAVRHGLARLAPADAEGKAQEGALVDLPNDTLHTFVRLYSPLTYRYKRDTTALYGNVVRATHGETRRETLGAGDATQAFQAFALKSPPLTYVAAPTPDGAASTLAVRVNQLLWKEAPEGLFDAEPNDRLYLTKRDDTEKTTVIFGDGRHGARLPTGIENVAAVYRSGIGAGGNVKAGQLTVTTDKPLGVKGVNNPIRASGGADADTLAQARINAPLAVAALDRLVSVDDYADFARVFAGIGKAAATSLHGPGGAFVHVTIAGIDDAPIDEGSDLIVNLREALRDFGDPHLPVRVEVRDALSLVIQLRIAIDPDYAWEDVEARLRAALIARFGFASRDLATPVIESDIVAAAYAVRGVAHVVSGEVKALALDELITGLAPSLAPAGGSPSFGTLKVGGTGDATVGDPGWIEVPGASVEVRTGKTKPAQIAYVPADVSEALLLELAP